MADESFVFLVGVTKKSIALLFCKYIESQGIASRIEDVDEGFMIFCDEDLFTEAEILWDDFKENPHASKYQKSAWESGETVKLNDNEALFSGVLQPFLAHAGLVTLSIFILCWLAFLGSELGWKKETFTLLHFYWDFNFDAVLQQPHRLIAAAFFHFSWLHIVFNTMWWWQLGGEIEKNLGKSTLLMLFILSAVLSNVGQFYSTGALFGGLSGVVYALVGYVWWLGWLAPQLGINLSKAMVGFLLFWLLLGFADVLPVNVANTAHSLGLVCGCLLAWLKAKKLNRVDG